MEELYTLLEKILDAKALTRLVCSRSKDRSVEKVSGRIIELRGLRTLQLETFTSAERQGRRIYRKTPPSRFFWSLCRAFARSICLPPPVNAKSGFQKTAPAIFPTGSRVP